MWKKERKDLILISRVKKKRKKKDQNAAIVETCQRFSCDIQAYH